MDSDSGSELSIPTNTTDNVDEVVIKPKDNIISKLVKSEFAKNLPIKKNERIQCVGNIQSGKTTQIIQLSLKLLSENYNVVIVNPMLKDARQMNKRFNDTFTEGGIEITKYVINLSQTNEPKLSKTLQKFENDPNQHIFIINSHYTKLSAFNNFYDFMEGYPLAVIMDESDLFNVDEDKYNKNTLSKCVHQLTDLIRLSDGFYGFTGTDYSHTHLNDLFPVTCRNMFYIPLNENYISYHNDKFKVIRYDSHIQADLYIARSKDQNGVIKDARWDDDQERVFRYIFKKEIQIAKERGAKIPMTLINVSTEISTHNYIKNTILKKHPTFTIIIVNGGKIQMFHNGDLKHFDMIQDALSFIQKDLNNHEYVCIISCKQFSRGTSPRSEVLNFKNVNDIIFASSIIYACAPGKATDELRQGFLRISGIFPGTQDNFQIRGYISTKLAEIFETQYEHDRLNRDEIQKEENADKRVTEVITPFNESKPHIMMSKSRGKFVAQKYIVNGREQYEVTEDRVDIRNKEIEETGGGVDDDEEDISHIIINRLKNRSDIISLFCCELKANVEYTRDNLYKIYNSVNNAGDNFNMFLYDNFRSRTKGGYGIIFDKTGGDKYTIKNKYSKFFVQ